MSKIYEAVRASIKSKIPAEKVVEDQVVDTNRDEILNLVPFHVKRAINSLQNRSIIPPKTTRIEVTDKTAYVDPNGEKQYEYIELPNDFSEIIDFTPDSVHDEYELWGNVNNIDRMSKMRGKPLYKVERINATDETDFIPVLVLSPFPEDGSIYVKYMFSPSDKYIENLEDKYWNAVITHVEKLLGIGRPEDADEEAYEMSRKWRQSKQRDKTRLKPNDFFVGGRRKRMR